MAAGDFTPALLQTVVTSADAIWEDSQQKRKYTPQAKALQTVLANQTAVLSPLTDRDKDNQLSLIWTDSSDIVATNGVPNCDITEPELMALSKPYTLDIRKKAGFSIDREKLRKSKLDRVELAAKGQLIALKQLDEIFAQILVARLSGFAGVNLSNKFGTVAGNTTNVPAAQYTALDMVPEIIRAAILNRMGSDFYALDGGELFADLIRAKARAKSDNQREDEDLFSQLNITSDLFNFASAGIQEDLFVVAKSAVAVGSKVRNSDVMEVLPGKVAQTRYTVDSPTFGAAVKYDAYYQLSCQVPAGSDREHIMDAWRFELNGGIWLNPEGLSSTNTGVLSYTKLAAAA
jgi:hypothetical protein